MKSYLRAVLVLTWGCYDEAELKKKKSLKPLKAFWHLFQTKEISCMFLFVVYDASAHQEHVHFDL